MEKVSVIIPVYNVENYIKKCLDSVLAQTYQNLEIILVDDGSTDNSGTICDDYAKKDDRIKVIHKENGGVSSARNEALDVASGKFLTFVDSDDYLKSSHIESLIELKNKYNSDLQVIGHSVVCENGAEKVQNENGEERLLNVDQALKLLLSPNYYCGFLWNKLYETAIVRENAITFDSSINIAEDLLFNCKYILSINSIIYNPKATYLYVQHKTSATNNEIISNKKLSAFHAYEMIVDLLKTRFPQVSDIARATIYNFAIHFLYLYYDDKANDEELKNSLKLKIKENYKCFLKSKNYTFKYKVMGILARFAPNLFYRMRRMKHKR